MIQRRRGPGGVNRDIDHGPGPVGLMPKTAIHGWAVAQAPKPAYDPRKVYTSGEERLQQMAEASRRYRARRRERETAA